LIIPQPDSLLKHDLPLASETDAEVTLKLHLVADGTTEERVAWVEEALRILATHKGLSGADHLLVAFRGVDYKGKKTAASEFFGCGAEGLESGMGSEHVAPETEHQVLEIWERLQSLVSDKPEANGNGATTSNGNGDAQIQPQVKGLGTLYFPLALLKRIVDSGAPPSINALDTPDCHHLPKEYTEFAKSAGVELWAGGGGEGAGECGAISFGQRSIIRRSHPHPYLWANFACLVMSGLGSRDVLGPMLYHRLARPIPQESFPIVHLLRQALSTWSHSVLCTLSRAFSR
jgi:hypothetical protein